MRLIVHFGFAFMLVMTSCQQSSDVVNKSLIQKRKYRNGWHLNMDKSKPEQQNQVSNSIRLEPDININEEVGDLISNQTIINSSAISKTYPYIRHKTGTSITSKPHIRRVKNASKKDLSNGFPQRIKWKQKPPDEDVIKEKKRSLIITGSILALLIVLATFGAATILVTGAFVGFVQVLFLYVVIPIVLVPIVGLAIAFVIRLIDFFKTNNGVQYLTEERSQRFGKAAKILATISIISMIATPILLMMLIVSLFLAIVTLEAAFTLVLVYTIGILLIASYLIYLLATPVSIGLASVTSRQTADGKEAGLLLILAPIISVIALLVFMAAYFVQTI